MKHCTDRYLSDTRPNLLKFTEYNDHFMKWLLELKVIILIDLNINRPCFEG